MPRIEADKPRSWGKILFSGLTAVIVLASVAGYSSYKLLKPAPVAAAGNQLPGPSCGTYPNGCASSQPMYSVLSQSSSANVIEAPDDYAKIYFDPTLATSSIKIFNAPFAACGNDFTDYDFINPAADRCTYPLTSVNNEVDYDFYGTDANEVESATPLFTFNGQNGTRSDGGAAVAVPASALSGAITFNLAAIPKSTLTGYKVVYLHSHFRTGLAGTETLKNHAYQLFTVNPTDQLGYVNTPPTAFNGQPASGQMIIHTTKPGAKDYETNFEIDFAPSCNVTTNQNVALRWFDADDTYSATIGGHDGDQFAGDTPPEFTFLQIPPTGPTISTRIYHSAALFPPNSSVPDIGGNNTYENLPFVAKPGWKYRWVWSHVNSATDGKWGGPPNNIMMWIPYDSINYNISCWEYHTKVVAAPGHPNGSTLDLSVPANRTLTIPLTANNVGQTQGPAGAIITPLAKVNGAFDGADVTPSGGPWTVPLGINGGQTVSGGQITSGGSVTYTLSTNLKGGDVVCFSSTISPFVEGDPGPVANDPPDICYTIANLVTRYPSVQGTGSDIHADAGACLGTPTNGATGAASGNSYGQYVVSSAGLISNFDSNSGLNSGRDLTLGSTGGYSKICQKDFYIFATANMPVGAAWTFSPGGVQDVNNLPGQFLLPNGKYVAYVLGDIHIQGIMTHSTTLIASGNVWIDGDITDSGGSNRTNAPTLAIISQGDVSVTYDSASPMVSAFIISDGTIDTCYTSGGGIPSGTHCQNVLHLNGFMLGKALKLNRLGDPGGSGSELGEIISMNPVLYLNPPQFLDASIDTDSALQGEGERAPLF